MGWRENQVLNAILSAALGPIRHNTDDTIRLYVWVERETVAVGQYSVEQPGRAAGRQVSMRGKSLVWGSIQNQNQTLRSRAVVRSTCRTVALYTVTVSWAPAKSVWGLVLPELLHCVLRVLWKVPRRHRLGKVI